MNSRIGSAGGMAYGMVIRFCPSWWHLGRLRCQAIQKYRISAKNRQHLRLDTPILRQNAVFVSSERLIGIDFFRASPGPGNGMPLAS
jgi:hypothetical protein